MDLKGINGFKSRFGWLGNRRAFLTGVAGSAVVSAAVAQTGSTRAALQEATPVPGAQESDRPPMPVTLVSKLAGEDLVSDWIRISDEPGMVTTVTHDQIEIDPEATAPSAVIDTARIAVTAYADAGDISVRVEVSPDNGGTWFWHPFGETEPSQFPAVQMGSLVSPLTRVIVTNLSEQRQTVRCWLVLAR
jgi:hypothetical protein